MKTFSDSAERRFSPAAYQRLAELRFRIRQFLHFSEEAAREKGLEPQQHQVLLAVKGLAHGTRPTILALASRLCLRHHSTVELVNRMAMRGLVVRRHDDKDRREALIELTEAGEDMLEKLSILHWQELQKQAPVLTEALKEIVEQ